MFTSVPRIHRIRLKWVKAFLMAPPAPGASHPPSGDFPAENKAFGGANDTSYIFVADDPRNAPPLRRFRFFHEIGHGSLMGNTIYSRPALFGVVATAFVLHLFFLGSIGGFWWGLAGVVFLVMVTINEYQNAGLVSELFADGFALACLDSTSEIQEVAKSRAEKYEQEAKVAHVKVRKEMFDETGLGDFLKGARAEKLLKERTRYFRSAFERPEKHLKRVIGVSGFSIFHIITLLILCCWGWNATPPTFPWAVLGAAVVPLIRGQGPRDAIRGNRFRDRLEALIEHMQTPTDQDPAM